VSRSRPSRIRRRIIWVLARLGIRIRIFRVGQTYAAVITPDQFRQAGAL